MKKILALLLLVSGPLAAQTIAPSQIKPGTNGQTIQTVGGKAAWANTAAGVTSVFGRTGTVVPVTGDYNCSQITSAICSLPTLFNQTVSVDGTSVMQRPLLNFINGTAGSVSCVDNPVTGATDCTITGGSSSGVTWTINDVSGSRTVNSAHQNTSAWPMYVGGSLATSGSGTGSILVAQGPSAFSMTLIDWKNQSTATVSSGSAGFSAVIAPGNYYVVQVSGAVTTTIQSWTEMTGAGSGGGGGGGGAAFPGTNGLVFNTSTIASRNAVFGDVVALWGSGSCTSGFLKFDGTCANPSGSGTVTNVSGATSSGFAVSTSSPTSTPVVSVAADSTHFLPLNTSGTSCFWNGGGTCTTPSGSGATFPGTNAIVFNTSTTASRNATVTDIENTIGSQSASQFLASPVGSSGNMTPRSLGTSDVTGALGFTPGPATPLPTANLIGSYTFNETSGNLLDRSGNGNNCTVISATGLTRNGIGYQFSNNTDELDCPSALNATNSFYFTVQIGFISPTTPANNPPFILWPNGTLGTHATAISTLNTSHSSSFYGLIAQDRGTSGGGTFLAEATDFYAGSHVIALICPSGAQPLFYFDGNPVAAYTGSLGSCNGGMTGGFYSFLNAAGMYITEADFYTSVDAAPEAQLVSTALRERATQKGFPFKPVPYSTAVKYTFALGDSIVCGAYLTGCVGGAVTAPQAWGNTINSFTSVSTGYTNFSNGTPSTQIENQISYAPYTYAPLCNTTTGQSFGYVMDGTNNFQVPYNTLLGNTAAQQAQRVAELNFSFVNLMEGYGCRMAIVAMISRGASIPGTLSNDGAGNVWDTDMVNLNAKLRANAKSNKAEAFVDLGSDPDFGALGAYNSTTWYSNGSGGTDFIHPSLAGQQRISAAAACILDDVNSPALGSVASLTGTSGTLSCGMENENFNAVGGSTNWTLVSSMYQTWRNRTYCNVTPSGSNTVTITAPSGEPFNAVSGLTTVVIPASTCTTFTATFNENTTTPANFWQITSSGSSGGSGPTIQTNSVNNSSQTTLNMETSTANSVGLTVTPSNPSGGIEKFEVTGSSYTGNAATASAVAVSGVTGLGTGVATFLATPSSANLAAAITDETGSGKAMFATSPTMLGTPDASGAAQFKLPVAAGFATLANGEQGYDTTALNWHIWGNGVDNIEAIFPASATINNTHCAEFLNTAGVITLTDSGGTCGGTGGLTFPQTVAGTTTSGGIPYFSSGTALTSSAVLPSGDFVLGGGTGGAPTATFSVVPIANGGTGSATVATDTVFGNPTGSTAAPTFTNSPVLLGLTVTNNVTTPKITASGATGGLVIGSSSGVLLVSGAPFVQIKAGGNLDTNNTAATNLIEAELGDTFSTLSGSLTVTGAWTGMHFNTTFGIGSTITYNSTTPMTQVACNPVINVNTASTGHYDCILFKPTETSIGTGVTNFFWEQQNASGTTVSSMDTTGFLRLNALGQDAASNTAGTCSMASSTSCTVTIAHTYTTPVCIATQQSATLTGASVGCTVSGVTVTITAATSNSETWGALVFGNPN